MTKEFIDEKQDMWAGIEMKAEIPRTDSIINKNVYLVNSSNITGSWTEHRKMQNQNRNLKTTVS